MEPLPSLASLCRHGNPEPGSWDRWAPGGSLSVWAAEGGEGRQG